MGRIQNHITEKCSHSTATDSPPIYLRCGEVDRNGCDDDCSHFRSDSQQKKSPLITKTQFHFLKRDILTAPQSWPDKS